MSRDDLMKPDLLSEIWVFGSATIFFAGLLTLAIAAYMQWSRLA